MLQAVTIFHGKKELAETKEISRFPIKVIYLKILTMKHRLIFKLNLKNRSIRHLLMLL